MLTPRGTTVTRGALPVPPVARGVPAPRARGSPTVPGYRAPPPPAHEGYEEYVSTLSKQLLGGVKLAGEQAKLPRHSYTVNTAGDVCCRKHVSLQQDVVCI